MTVKQVRALMLALRFNADAMLYTPLSHRGRRAARLFPRLMGHRAAMSVPTGFGNYPPGVTDNDPHFDSEECQHNEGGIRGGYCTDCGELVDEDAASEAAWERQQEDGFRGGEAAAFMAEQQEKARRLK